MIPASRSKNTQDGLRQLELAALPTGKEWSAWWRHRKNSVEMTFGWERAIIDAVTRLVKNNLTLARQIRFANEAKNMIRYDGEGHIEGEETRWPDEITREALVWFINVVKPAQKDAPQWAEILFKAVEGCYLQQARLGLELSGVKKRGYLTLNASATAPMPNSFTSSSSENI
jgi:hypothetical protein